MALSEIPREVADRGIWWQIIGFTLVGALCLVILVEFAGSDSKLYRYFAAAVTDLYWALVIVLAGLIDRGRSMFETKAEIRRAARARVWEEGRQEGQKEGEQKGRQETRSEVGEMLRRHAVRDEATGRITLELTPEIAALLEPPDSGSPG